MIYLVIEADFRVTIFSSSAFLASRQSQLCGDQNPSPVHFRDICVRGGLTCPVG